MIPPQTQRAPLTDKSALVTGAAQGLGKALAQRLAEAGAQVALVDLQPETLEETAAEMLEQHPGRIVSAVADVTDEAQVEQAMEHTTEAFGKLDICVSNAGILISGPITEFDVSSWQKVMEVNLLGYMIVAKHAARVMIPREEGVIIQINSKSGKKGSYKNSAYASSKFGGIGLTQSLALELADHDIRVNAICPGNLLDSPLWVESLYEQYAERWEMTEGEVRQMYVDKVPLKRGCTYDDVANTLLFLCSNEADYITGQAINVDGGQTMH
ncbi:MAG: sorbitol-6-phosphate dehydrogenase [Armatimonadota bacterium]